MSSPNLLYNHEGRFPSKRRNQTKKPIGINENTQTSKTILQLADFELQNAINVNKSTENRRSPEIGDLELRKLRFDRKSNILEATINDSSSDNLYTNINFESMETSNIDVVKWDQTFPRNKKKHTLISPNKWSRFSVREIRIKSFNVDEAEIIGKSSTSLNEYSKTDETSPSFNESQYEGRISDESCESYTTATTVDSKRRAKSLSPPPTHRSYENNFTGNIPVKEETGSSKSSDANRNRDKFNLLMIQVKSSNWNISLKAMMEIANISEELECDRLFGTMPELNQRLIVFLRSPRSQVCRTGCQIAGRFFEIVKDTRRPEFDAIVDLLLLRTADANKFIRNDANLALDTLIIHIPPFHTIRAISQKAPTNKNDLVRITSARLMVCIVGLAGADAFLNPTGNEASRKRLLHVMVKFVLDKNVKTREYGARLYVSLHKHPQFEQHLKKIVSKANINEMKKIIKNVNLD